MYALKLRCFGYQKNRELLFICHMLNFYEIPNIAALSNEESTLHFCEMNCNCIGKFYIARYNLENYRVRNISILSTQFPVPAILISCDSVLLVNKPVSLSLFYIIGCFPFHLQYVPISLRVSKIPLL